MKKEKDMAKPTGERIASIEQHMLDQDQKLTEIQSDIKEIKITLQANATLSNEVTFLKQKVSDLEKSKNIQNWVSPIVASLLTAVIGFLLIQYLQNLRCCM